MLLVRKGRARTWLPDENRLVMKAHRSSRIVEFGDFQTPAELADQLCRLLRERGLAPRAVVEPTCGTGAFVRAAGRSFEQVQLFGSDIHAEALQQARRGVEADGLGIVSSCVNSTLSPLIGPASSVSCLSPCWCWAIRPGSRAPRCDV